MYCNEAKSEVMKCLQVSVPWRVCIVTSALIDMGTAELKVSVPWRVCIVTIDFPVLQPVSYTHLCRKLNLVSVPTKQQM